MRRNLFLAGSIIAFGALAAGSVFAFSFFQTDAVPASPQWTQQAGLGVAVPACGSSSIGTISCVNGANSVPFTWQDNGNTDGVTCTSAYFNTSVGVRDGFSCSGSSTWYPAPNNTTVNYEIRYRTASKFICDAYVQTCDSKSGVCTNAIPLQCATGHTDTYTYPNGQGHVIASGTLTTNNCQPPTPDIKANDSDGPLNLDFGTAILTWKVGNNPTSCTASGAWSGNKPEEGVETVFTEAGKSYTYTLSCANYAGTVADSVTVNSNPALSANVSFTPPSPVDPNTTVTWTANVAGGNGTYSYAWTCDGQLCGTNSSQVQQTYATDGPRTATVTITSGIQTAIAFASLVVNQGLGVSIDVSPANPSVGDIVTWAANATGGQGPGSYAYAWNLDGAAKSGNPVAMTYDTGGQKNASVTVTSGTQTASANSSVSVAWLPVTANIKANGQDGPINVEFGQSATLTWSSTNASGGCTVTPGGWTGTSNSIGQSTGPLTANTTYTLNCTGAGGSDSDTVTVNVGNELTASCSASPASAIVGEPVNWTAVASGGTGTPSYTWAFTGHSVTAGTGQSVSKIYSTAGEKGASITITSGSQSITSICSGATVYAPTLIIDPGTAAIAFSGTQQFAAKYDPDGPGGSKPEQIVTADAGTEWASSLPSAVSVNNTTAKGLATAAGEGSSVITASYTDSFGNTLSATANVSVSTAPLTASCAVSPTSAATNQNVTWTAAHSGGTGEYTYSWTGTNGLTGAVQSVTKSYAAEGSKTAEVTVTSGTQKAIVPCQSISVYAPTLVISPGSANILLGSTLQLVGLYDPDGPGGSKPEQIVTADASWSSNNTAVATINNTTSKGLVKGDGPGAASITAAFTDSFGNILTAASAIAVNPSELSVNCSVSPISAITRQDVTWSSGVTGGIGSYTYKWSGTDNLSGSSFSVVGNYAAEGFKTGVVVVTSGSQTATSTECSGLPNGMRVYQPTLVAVPGSAAIQKDGTVQLAAKFDQDGPGGSSPEVDVTGQSSWVSDNPARVAVNNTTQKGLATGIQAGSATISATYVDGYQNELTATAVIAVDNGAPVARARVATDGSTFADSITIWRGTSAALTLDAGESFDPNGWTDAAYGVSSGGKCEWNTDLGTNLPLTFETVVDSPLSPAACNITLPPRTFDEPVGTRTYQVLRIMDKPGAISDTVDTITIVVENPPSTFVINPGTAAINFGSSLQLAGLYDPDGPGGPAGEQNVTSSAVWSSGSPAVVTVNSTGLATSVGSGNAVITARYTDSLGQTITATANITVENASPVANAKISKDNATFTDAIVVTQGLPTTIYLLAADSSDPNGWTDPNYGVSSGGKCEWNSNLDRDNPPTFEPADTKNNPASPGACNISLGVKTFNDAPNTYTYQVLKITDNGGKVSENIDTVSVTVVAAEPLTASCAALPTAATKGQSVVWSANPLGGVGIYSYSWSGTDDLSGTATTVVKAYGLSGIKNAAVTVQSGTQTLPPTACPAVTVFNPTLVVTDPSQENFSGKVNISVNGAKPLEALYDADGPSGPDSDVPVTGASDWASSNEAIATVVDGLVIGQAPGVVTITATYSDNFGNTLNATAEITVYQPTITILPGSVEMGYTSTDRGFQLETMYDPDGASGSIDPWPVTDAATWNSSEQSVVIVSSSGFLSGRSAGTAVITVRFTDVLGNNLIDTADVAVKNAPRLSCSPVSQEILVGKKTAMLRAVGGDLNDREWSAPEGSPGEQSGTQDAFQTTYNTTGEKTISLSSAGLSTTCVVNVVDPALAVMPARTDLAVRQTDQLSALYDSDGPDGPNEPDDLAPFSTWASDNTAVATVSTGPQPRGVITGKAAGSAAVEATFVAFSKTLKGSAEIVVHASSLTVKPSSANLSASGPNDKIQLEALYDPDGETGTQAAEDVTLDAAWSSSNTSRADVNNTDDPKGLVHALSAGTADITARFTDAFGNILSALSRMTITSSPPVTCEPLEQAILLGGEASFSASDGDGTTYNWTAPGGTPSTGTGRTFSARYNSAESFAVDVSSNGTSATCVVIVTEIPGPEPENEGPPRARDPNAPAPIRGFREVPPNPNLLKPEDIIPNIRITP